MFSRSLGSFLTAIGSKLVKYSFSLIHRGTSLLKLQRACFSACEQARHPSSMDCSAHIVMEIALETVAPMHIFRSVSELRGRKTALRGGKPPAGPPALRLPPAAWWSLAGSLVGMGFRVFLCLVRQGEGSSGGEAPTTSVSKETLGAAWLSLCCMP